MNANAAKLFASSSISSLLRQRVSKAAAFALYDVLSQPSATLSTATWRHQTVRPMSSIVITQTKAGDTPLKSSPATVSAQDQSNNSATTTLSSESTSPLTVTPSCFQRIQHLLQQRNKSPDSMYLRVFVDAGGCSGFQYQFDLIEDAKEAVDPEQDVVLSSETGARLVVDQTSLQYMKGATVDYVQQMIKSAFSVTHNPQSESACGCGSSFAVKNFSSNPAMD